jgi:hypothetical protein
MRYAWNYTSRHARLLKPNVYVLAPAADQQGNG